MKVLITSTIVSQIKSQTDGEVDAVDSIECQEIEITDGYSLADLNLATDPMGNTIAVCVWTQRRP